MLSPAVFHLKCFTNSIRNGSAYLIIHYDCRFILLWIQVLKYQVAFVKNINYFQWRIVCIACQSFVFSLFFIYLLLLLVVNGSPYGP